MRKWHIKYTATLIEISGFTHVSAFHEEVINTDILWHLGCGAWVKALYIRVTHLSVTFVCFIILRPYFQHWITCSTTIFTLYILNQNCIPIFSYLNHRRIFVETPSTDRVFILSRSDITVIHSPSSVAWSIHLASTCLAWKFLLPSSSHSFSNQCVFASALPWHTYFQQFLVFSLWCFMSLVWHCGWFVDTNPYALFDRGQ